MQKVSIQMYSLRELCDDNFVDILKKVAEAGYDAVELAGTYGLSANELKGHLDRLGLSVSGAHIGLDELKTDFESVAAYQWILQNNLLICPYASTETIEEVNQLIEDLKEINERCLEQGFTLGYHNHAHEFKVFNEEYALNLIKNGTPASMKFELDAYWADVAGVDVAAYLETLGDRCIALHLKDRDTEGNNVEVGSGVIDFKKLLRKAKEFKITNLVVEQEEFQIDPIDSITISYENILKLAAV